MEMQKCNIGLPGRYFCFSKASAGHNRLDPILVIAILTIWIGVLPRVVVPSEYTDRGGYVSVAERLLAGDALYSGVRASGRGRPGMMRVRKFGAAGSSSWAAAAFRQVSR